MDESGIRKLMIRFAVPEQAFISFPNLIPDMHKTFRKCASYQNTQHHPVEMFSFSPVQYMNEPGFTVPFSGLRKLTIYAME